MQEEFRKTGKKERFRGSFIENGRRRERKKQMAAKTTTSRKIAKKEMKFNPVFKPVHESRQRYVLLKGGAGSGKSYDTAQFLMKRILTEPGRNLLCVRKIFESNRLSTMAELQGVIERMGLKRYFTVTKSPMEIRCANGNCIEFAGCNDAGQRDKLKSIQVPGGSLTDVWIEEATELTPADFHIIDDRLRGDLPEGLFYQIRMTFNPVSSSHWIKSMFFDEPDENVLTCHSTYLDNQWCDMQYQERMERRKKFDPEGYRIYALGEWGESGGLILPNIMIEAFDIAAMYFDHTAIGQDFGFNHPNAILELGIKDGEVYIRREIYLREKDTSELIAEANGAGFDRKAEMYCDAAEPDRIAMWQKAGYCALPCYKASGSVRAEIDWLKQRLIHIHPDCVNTIREIQGWRWVQDHDGRYTDVPTPVDDHAMAALRYGTQPWQKFGCEKRERSVQIPNDAFHIVIQDHKGDALGRGKRVKPI